MVEKRIDINEFNYTNELFGNFDENIKFIEGRFNVNIVSRQGEVVIIGENESVKKVIYLFYRNPAPKCNQ